MKKGVAKDHEKKAEQGRKFLKPVIVSAKLQLYEF